MSIQPFPVHFSDQQVDVAVLEVGLGGRFDATNVVCDVYSSNIRPDVGLQACILIS
jgi:hypothetical protein